MTTFVLGLASGLFGAYLLTLLEPVQRWLARGGRHLLNSDGLRVHVESDPAVIWAGLPDWQGFFYYLPGQVDLTEPPANPRQWRTWISELGGWDLYESIVRITIVATAPTTVILETPVVEAVAHKLPPGRKILHRVGGADLQPRAFYVDLDMFGLTSPQVTLADIGGDEKALPRSYAMKKDDVEVFLLRVTSQEPQLVTWRARIPLLVDGRREIIDITNRGYNFKFAGGDLRGQSLHWDHGWHVENA